MNNSRLSKINRIHQLIAEGADVNVTDDDGKTALIYAVQLSYNVVPELIAADANVNITDNKGKTALFYAVQKRNEIVVRSLIAAGADVNRTDNEGKTSLFYAVQKWKTESVVRALIAADANVNITDNKGKTALFYAVQKRNEIVVRSLIAAGADVNRTDNEGKTALFYAAQQSNNEIVVRSLIAAGADVNRTDNEGKTSLFYAVQQGNNESVVRVLIADGADVNITDNEGKSALFYAVQQWYNESVVRALTDADADVNRTDNEGKTSLFYAVQTFSNSVVGALIAAGADVNTTDNEGKTALFYAVQQINNESMVHALIVAGADVNRTDNEGKTALLYAVQQWYNESVVRALTDAGADVNITDNEEKTALFYAVQESYNESVVRALIDAGADVNRTDNEEKTALFYAVQSNHTNVVYRLVNAGVDVNLTDDEGKTALFYVKDHNSRESANMARILIECGGAALVEARDNYGRTPLFYAMTKSLSLAQYLIEKGGDLHLKDDCSVLTFFIDNYYFDLSIKHIDLKPFEIHEGLSLLKINCKVKKNSIFEAIVSVVFSRMLCMVIDAASLSELLKRASDFTLKIDTGKRKMISKLLERINDRSHKERLGYIATILTRLNKLGANPNTVDSDGNTALHYATQLALHGVSEDKVMEICHQLEECKVSFNVKNHKNENPLLFCLSRTVERISRQCCTLSEVKTQVAVCKFLIDLVPKVDEKTQSGESVLHLVMDLLRQALLEQDGELRKGIVGEVTSLIEEVFKACKEKGLSAISQNNSGNTPLHLWATLKLASDCDHDYSSTLAEEHIFQRLLNSILNHFRESNAQLNDRNQNGETPLHLCRTWTAVELLLDAGANPNDVDSSGRSPLLVAAKRNESLKNLGTLYFDVSLAPHVFWITVLKRGLDPWTVDKDGESVLGMVIKSESRDLASAMVKVACEKVRDHLLVMFYLLTSICRDTLANAHWKKDIAEKILSSTKCPLNGNENENSPLHYCCKNIMEALNCLSVDETKTTVHWSMVKLLRSYGADYRIPDASGQTCLDIAEKCPALKELLLEDIDLDGHPVLIKEWKRPVSKTHERYLAEVARYLESVQVESYWYHKDPLASGSFGTVFVGINENDGREVAIKRVENVRVQQSKGKREISNLISLAECEQVVRYLNVLRDENFSYIVLELMEGSLDELPDNTIKRDTKVTLCQHVVKGLQFLHHQNIIHRDLKPKNILFKAHPKLGLKIADFGLSRCMDSTGSTSSVYGSNAGTRCWIAPEVLNSTKQHSMSSDVFACGLVLHYILSVKKHPFAPADCAKKGKMQIDHETEANIKKGHMEGWDDSLCPEGAHLIKQMLDSDDSKRPAADKALDHPFFWTQKKKTDFLIAVGNQPEFECPRAKRTLPLTAVETDLEASFGIIVKYVDWNDPGYVQMPAIYTEMTRRRRYDTKSVVELVRFVRNAIAHVSESTRPTSIKKQLLEDFVVLEYFSNLVMEVYKAVTTHGWDQTKGEIKYAMKK